MNTKVNEGKLISGKDALIALANGGEVEIMDDEIGMPWSIISKEKDDFKNPSPCMWMFLNQPSEIKFRLKPRTILINGIEVPAPAEDEDYRHQGIWILNSLEPKEYGYVVLDITDELPRYWWKSEEEIKQVVAALRQVFGGSHDN